MSRGAQQDWFDGINSGDCLNDLEVNEGMYHWGVEVTFLNATGFFTYQGGTPDTSTISYPGSTVIVHADNRTHIVSAKAGDIVIAPPRRDGT